VAHTNITVYKRAEEAVASVAKFPGENPNPVLRIEHQGRLTFANAASRPVLKKWGCRMGESVPRKVWRLCTEAIRSGRTIEWQELCKDRVYSLLVTPIAGRDYVNLYGRDETGRMRIQDALLESELRYRLLFNRNPDGVFAVDARGRFLLANPACEVLSGYTQQELLQRTFRDLCAPELVDEAVAHFQEQLKRGSAPPLETAVIRKDGTRLEVWVSGETLILGGKTRAVYCTVKDITRQKAFRAELERLVRERTAALQETTDQLNAFMYTLAHDLRAPLRAQVGFAGLLVEEFGEALGEKGRDFARRIEESADRQGRLLSDLLKHVSLSRADLPMEAVDLEHVVKQAQAELNAEVERKQANVALGVIAGRALANPPSLHLIVTNLLSNALKFVAPGVRPEVKIWSEFCHEPQGSSGGELAAGGAENPGSQPAAAASTIRLWVEDNGLGIRNEHLGKLFGVFQRLHPGAEYPGTGIGLAIVKKAAERMGGRVGVYSEAGKGSRFWVELKAVDSDGNPVQAPSI
jgi:PAS domain S-box-containing protein